MNNIPVKNINETLVDMHVAGIIQNLDVCDCPRCVADIKALALNALMPRYASTEQGEYFLLHTLNSPQEMVTLQVAISEAAARVAAHPRHISERQSRDDYNDFVI